jgi:iron complex transport system substrate-binding protein
MEITMNSKNSSQIFLFLALLVACFTSICVADVTFTDSAGIEISLPSQAERVVCLNSDASEMIAALGAGNMVIGVTESVLTDTELMKHLPKAVSVGDWQTPSVEKILQLKPDAVISYSSSKPKNVDQFIGAGISLIYLDCYKITTLEDDVTSLGTMIGAEKSAEKYVTFLKKWEDLVRFRVVNLSSQEIPTVYVEGYSDYSAQGKGSGVDLLMDIAKGKNLAADLGEQWPKVTPEWVISQDPSIIVKTASLKPEKSLEVVRSDLLNRKGFEVIQAVKEKEVYVLNGDLTYGPRSPAGLVYLAKVLHPDEFKDISPSDVLKEYAETFVSGMENGDYYSPIL